MHKHPIVPLLAAGALLALSACSDSPAPVADCSRCGPNQTCAADGACLCKSGFLDCDGESSNGCETQAEACQSCVPESDAEFCVRLGKNCDFVTDLNNCGQQNSAQCGACAFPQVCGGGGLPNVCGECVAESDERFCLRLGLDCGIVTDLNNCGQRNTADCGTCTSPLTCGGGGSPNVCGSGCAAESAAQLCARLGKSCGALTAENNCGARVTVDCGLCTQPETCGGGGTPNVCGTGCQAETDAELCARLGRACGPASGLNNCNVQVTADCGLCAGGAACDASGQCVACTPSCTGRVCGDDGCGGSCGSCSQGTCNASGQCVVCAAGTTRCSTDDLSVERCANDGTGWTTQPCPQPGRCDPASLTCVAGTEQICNDAIDDDGDGMVDCADPDCAASPACEPSAEQDCTNGVDDDGDGATDCFDSDCAGAPNCAPGGEVCDNNADDDGDGAVDCQDSECAAELRCQPEDCTNGVDDNGDGVVDCQDLGCMLDPACIAEMCAECDNVICTFGGLSCGEGCKCSMTGKTESGCADSADNDGDGVVDCADFDCAGLEGCP